MGCCMWALEHWSTGVQYVDIRRLVLRPDDEYMGIYNNTRLVYLLETQHGSFLFCFFK